MKKMNIVLLGYGKMGQVIERLATARGHSVVGRIDAHNRADFEYFTPENTDVVIEFSHPEAAFDNICQSLRQRLPTVSGTTGWLGHRAEVEQLCQQTGGAFFYASNYSIGVNLFFRLNRQLARLMAPHADAYRAELTEIHHVHKKDAPSGTAITLAEGLLAERPDLPGYTPAATPGATGQVPIHSVREGEVPGTHTVRYVSAVDEISIRHEAYSHEGFALGAVIAAEWLPGRHGWLGMDDLLADGPAA